MTGDMRPAFEQAAELLDPPERCYQDGDTAVLRVAVPGGGTVEHRYVGVDLRWLR